MIILNEYCVFKIFLCKNRYLKKKEYLPLILDVDLMRSYNQEEGCHDWQEVGNQACSPQGAGYNIIIYQYGGEFEYLYL